MAAGSLLVVAVDVVQAPNGKQQVEPMLGKISSLPEDLGKAETLLADTGYFSADNVDACDAAGIEPVIAMGRQPHHPPLAERFEKVPAAPDNPTPVENMAHRLKTPEGRALYAPRKQTPEPVFGIIKSALGFRQFSMRGLDKARGEWSLVATARNIKRMFLAQIRGMMREISRQHGRCMGQRSVHGAVSKPPRARHAPKRATGPNS